MHVLKVQQKRLLWNVCIRTGMLAPSKSMAKLQLTSAGLEFPPRSPSSHRGTAALLAWSDLSLHLLDKIPGSERHQQRASTNVHGYRLSWGLYGALVLNANKHEWWRLPSGFWQDQRHKDSFYFSIIICNGCNMQYPHCNKPSPLVSHHTIAGNQIREV